MATSWTGGVLMVSAIQSQLGYGEVLDVDNALGGVWHVCTRSKHRWLPWEKMVGTGSIKVITCPVHIESRISATVSINPTSSRAIATTTWLAFLPRATSWTVFR